MRGKFSKKTLNKVLLILVNIIFSLLIIGPILYAVSVSFMTPSEIFETPPKLIPGSLYFQNYKDAIRVAPLFKFILNSLYVSSAMTTGRLIIGCLAAYAFTFMRFRGTNILFIIILSTMMIPGETIVISNYLTISSWGMLDTFTGLILPFTISAFGIFFLRQSFLMLPKELHEAAKIDGCSNFRFLLTIVIPLSKPALGALGVYFFLQSWNYYLWPLLVTNTDRIRTVQIGIDMLSGVEVQALGLIMAGIVMILIPSIFAFIIGQKQLISGLTAGSIKS